MAKGAIPLGNIHMPGIIVMDYADDKVENIPRFS